jgi:predicted CoA-binding protein
MNIKTTLVFGASLKPHRYAYMAIKKLREKQHPVKAFGLTSGSIDDVVIDTQLKPYEHIDTVTLYLNPKAQRDYYDYILNLNPRRVIFNPGTENQEFIDLLQQAGINCEIACTLVLLSIDGY